MKTYLVGGAVRDGLLERPIKERDWVVVGGTSEEMLAQGYVMVGKDFPVFLHPQTKEEYALARIERKVSGGYHGFIFDTAKTVTLEDDLRRRDLTINAMAKTETGEIIDPYGGQRDLQRKILRHVSDAFVEDPVRVLRVARFLARMAHDGFTIAPETMALMSAVVQKGECDFLVAERVWKEMERALSERQPTVFIQTLRACGALEKILPEINQLYGVPQSPRWHPEIDTGVHIELVLAQAAELTDDSTIRFAALMHDIGKGLTERAQWPDHAGHEEKGAVLLKAVTRRLKVPRAYHEQAYCVTRFHGEYHHFRDKTAEEKLSMLERLDVFRRPERGHAFLIGCLADFRGRPGYEQQEHPAQVAFHAAWNAALTVDVKPIVAKRSSKEGAEIQAAIRAARVSAIEKIEKW